MISVEYWKNLTQPSNHCSMIDAPYDTLDAFNLTSFMVNNASTSRFIECKAWEYDMSLIGKTIVSEWSIVCGRGYLTSVVESCFLAGRRTRKKNNFKLIKNSIIFITGAGLGSVSSGWISDQYGRKPTLMAFATIQLVTGMSTQECANF